MSPPRLSALAAVVATGRTAIGALAAAEGVSAPTMTRLIDGLERDGLVARIPDPDDARGVLVRPSAHGRRLLGEGRARRVRNLAGALQQLSKDDLAAVRYGAELIERVTRSS